jgi:hypothetical protein
LFLVIILATEKASIDGSSVADCKTNDGLARIRTGDLAMSRLLFEIGALSELLYC